MVVVLAISVVVGTALAIAAIVDQLRAIDRIWRPR
jgi:hypothetical protein